MLRGLAFGMPVSLALWWGLYRLTVAVIAT